jgi:hypothetical protein
MLFTIMPLIPDREIAHLSQNAQLQRCSNFQLPSLVHPKDAKVIINHCAFAHLIPWFLRPKLQIARLH